MGTRRYQRLNDLFTVTCRACESTDVDVCCDSCNCCGNTITATCNNCDNSYDYHDFNFGEFDD